MTPRIGTAGLVAEMDNRFSLVDREFDNESRVSFDFALSRQLGTRWEAGLQLTTYTLSGSKDDPRQLSAAGRHYAFQNLVNMPVSYETTSLTQMVFLRFYFIPLLYSGQINAFPYVEAGVGSNLFTTGLSYNEKPPAQIPQTIFTKGKGKQPDPGFVFQYTTGIGTRLNFKRNWDLILALNLDVADYACLDATHNYSESGERLNLNNVIMQLKAGISVPLSRSSFVKEKRQKYYMPWAP